MGLCYGPVPHFLTMGINLGGVPEWDETSDPTWLWPDYTVTTLHRRDMDEVQGLLRLTHITPPPPPEPVSPLPRAYGDPDLPTG